MCTEGCVQFARSQLGRSEVAGRSVLDVGSCDVNGTVRAIVEQLGASTYVGVDIADGPGVDVVCSAEGLIERFGSESFDVVLTTEMLEHVRDWRTVVHNLKGVLRPGGILVLTTRSRGFPFHGYPADYWRFELSDMSTIFSDMDLEALQSDVAASPGVFLRARRPVEFIEQDLAEVRVYSVVRRCRTDSATTADVMFSRSFARAKSGVHRVLPGPARRTARRLVDSAVGGLRPGR